MATPAAVLSIVVEAQTGKAAAELGRFNKGLSDKSIRVTAEIDRGSFEKAKAAGGALGGRETVNVAADVDMSSFARARAAQAVLTKESSRLGDVFNRSQLSIGQWIGILGASVPVVVDLAGALGALTASAAAATAGLGALAVGIGGALTVGLGGIASIAVPAIASLKDVITGQEALNKARSTGAASASKAAAAAAEQITAAENTLANAQRSEKIAQDSLNLARKEAVRDLQDMHRAAIEGGTSEKRAKLSLQQAEKNLRDLRRQDNVSMLDIRDAELSVVEARQNVKDVSIAAGRAQQDYNKAQKGGISQMPGVVAAQRSLADAQRSTADANHALAQAQRQANAATGAGATQLAALQLAQKKAGPEAVKFAKNLKGMTQRWKGLTKEGRADFFGMLNDGLGRVNKKLPLLAKSANESMGALRKGFDAFLDRAMGPGFNKFIDVMTRTFANSMGPISKAFGNIAIVLERLAVAVAPDIVRMMKGFEEMTKGWVDSTRNAKDLRETVHGLVNQAHTWWKLIKAVGDLFVTALSPGAKQGKRAIMGITDQIKEWTRWIDKHPKQVKDFFKEGLETTRRLAEALLSFLPTFLEISEAMRPIARGFLAMLKGLNTLKVGNVSALTVLLGAIVAGRMAKGIAGMVESFKRLKTAALGAAGAEQLALSPKVAAPTKATTAASGGAAAASAFPFAGMGVGKGKVPITKAASTAEGAFPFAGMGKEFQGSEKVVKGVGPWVKYAKVMGGLAVAVTAVVGAFEALRTNFLGVRDVFKGFFEKVLKPIGKAFSDLVDEVTGGHAGDVFGAIGDAIDAVKGPVGWFVENVTKVVGLLAIGAIAGPLVLAITALSLPLRLAVKGITLLIKGIKALVGFVKDKFPGLGKVLAAPFKWLFNAAKDVFNWIKDHWGSIGKVLSAPFRWLFNAARDAFNFVKDKVGGVIGTIKDKWPFIKNVLTAPFDALKGIVKGVFSFIKGKVEWLVDKLEWLVDKIKWVTDKLPGGSASGEQSQPGRFRTAPGQFGTNLPDTGHLGGLVTKAGIQHFAAGGMVRGAGNKDTVPALLTPGEMVLPKNVVDSTRKNAKLTAAAMTGELGKGYKKVRKDSEEFEKGHRKTLDRLRDTAEKITGKFKKTTVDDFQKTSKEADDSTDKMRSKVSDGFQKTKQNSMEATGQMKQGVTEDFRNLTGAVNEGIRKIAKMTNNALKALGVKKVDFSVSTGKGHKRGGPIDGKGEGDTVPAMLEPGEFVVNKKATKRHRAALEHINFKDAPRFAKGGAVSADFGGHPSNVSGALKKLIGIMQDKFPGLAVSATTDGNHVANSDHYTGHAVDLASSDFGYMDKAGRWAVTSGLYKQLKQGIHNPTLAVNAGKLVDGPGFYQGFWATHRDHIHMAVYDSLKGAFAAAVEEVKKVTLKGPKGPLTDMGQAALDKVRGAANRYLTKHQPMGDIGGKGLVGGSAKENARLGHKMLTMTPGRRGPMSWGPWGESEWPPYNKLIMSESGWSTTATNPSSGAYGIPQSLPASKMAAAGKDWRTNAATQIAWGLDYIKDVYGAPSNTPLGGYRKGGIVAAPFVGSFAQGGTVARDGMAKVHRGEHISPPSFPRDLIRALRHLVHFTPEDSRKERRQERRLLRQAARADGARQIKAISKALAKFGVDFTKKEQERLRKLANQQRHGGGLTHQEHRELRGLRRERRQFAAEKEIKQQLAVQREMLSEQKELRRELDARDRRLQRILAAEIPLRRALRDMAANEIGDLYEKKRRNASAGSAARY